MLLFRPHGACNAVTQCPDPELRAMDAGIIRCLQMVRSCVQPRFRRHSACAHKLLRLRGIPSRDLLFLISTFPSYDVSIPIKSLLEAHRSKKLRTLIQWVLNPYNNCWSTLIRKLSICTFPACLFMQKKKKKTIETDKFAKPLKLIRTKFHDAIFLSTFSKLNDAFSKIKKILLHRIVVFSVIKIFSKKK